MESFEVCASEGEPCGMIERVDFERKLVGFYSFLVVACCDVALTKGPLSTRVTFAGNLPSLLVHGEIVVNITQDAVITWCFGWRWVPFSALPLLLVKIHVLIIAVGSMEQLSSDHLTRPDLLGLFTDGLSSFFVSNLLASASALTRSPRKKIAASVIASVIALAKSAKGREWT